MSKKVKFFLARLLSLVVLSILGFRQLRRQFSEEYIADYQLRLDAQGRSGFVELLVLEDIAANSLYSKTIREHAKSIEAYLVARDISTIDRMLHDNEAYRKEVTNVLSLSKDMRDPEIFRARFLFYTGGLAKNGERIHLNCLEEQLQELGAPPFKGDVEPLKNWFLKRYGLPVETMDRVGSLHKGCNNKCRQQFDRFSQKERGKIRRRIRAHTLENRKSFLDQAQTK